MDTAQFRFNPGRGWTPDLPGPGAGERYQLVLLFGATAALDDPSCFSEVRRSFPGARLVGCSTAGEIAGTEVHDGSVVMTAVRFVRTRVALASTRISDPSESRAAGMRLGAQLAEEGLAHVLVLSDGLRVNGSALVAGLLEELPAGVSVTGGLSADGSRFQRTLVVADAPPVEGAIAALGLHGDHIRVGCGTLGGWDPFGPERLVTRSSGNVLHELDSVSALSLYKKYLGEHAEGLPATGLLFPICLRSPDSQKGVVRTILGVDEPSQSMTFAGDMPEGHYARLMKANFERLIDGASGAARASYQPLQSAAELAILISCVGRKLVLKQRVEEEVESVRDVLGSSTRLTGFYSYGELAPHTPSEPCELHNQTMTITTFAEL